MKVEFWAIGKTNARWIEEGIAIYEKRLRHYLPFQTQILPDVKIGATQHQAELQKEKEADLVLAKLKSEDRLILLDESGKSYSSVGFAQFMEQQLSAGGQRLVFLVGGAYGFSDRIYARAWSQLSLSAMTFSHQMVRPFFLEQLYRAMSILRNEPYHNH